ncbi:D-Ala-D-Ala carboxypeptidase family metallohydrolase [Ideonella sp. DXS29W]|uniref:D-Ala-D-Ala carboxypeptidase family metallohydrolase n=1 Tax=Ideonella lacteola TaxID=2984193 RepID=A0ABU9BTX3_9BURK
MKHLKVAFLGTLCALGAAPAWSACGDSRDSIIREYDTYNVSLNPTCSNFTNRRRTEYFAFSELETGDYSWALLRTPFMAAKSTGYGVDKWRYEYGGPRYTNSVYRNPARNSRVGGASQSRHMYGDAADLDNRSNTSSEWNNMYYAAGRAHADWREPSNGPCGYACNHADWRSHSGGYATLVAQRSPMWPAAVAAAQAKLASVDLSLANSVDWSQRAAALNQLLDVVGGPETLGFRAGDVGDLLSGMTSPEALQVRAILIDMLAQENREVLEEQQPISEERSEYHAALTGLVANLRDGRALGALVAALPTGYMAQRGVALLGNVAVPALAQAFGTGVEPMQAGALHALEALLGGADVTLSGPNRRAAVAMVLAALSSDSFNLRLAAVPAAASLARVEARVAATMRELAETDPHHNLDPEGVSPVFPVRAAIHQALAAVN